MKKPLLLLLAIMLTINSYAQYTLTNDDVVVESGVLTEYTNTTEKDIIIPETLDGQTVTVIGENAFYSNSMQGIVLPSTITSLEFRSLTSNGLTTLVIPNSVTSIAKESISGNDITSLTIPNTVSFIGAAAFNGSKIATINGEAFDGIFYKRNIDGSEDKTTIVSYAGSSKVIDFIPASVTSIENNAFERSDLTNVTIPNTVTSLGTYSFAYNDIKTVTLPNTITLIPSGIFTGSVIEEIEIPNTVTEIGSFSFTYNKLTSLDIPSSVETIGTYSFAYNELTSMVFPNNVTAINSFAFYQNDLTSITLPNSLERIEQYSFSYNLLTEIDIPNTVTTIERTSLNNNKFTSITIPSSVTSIGSSAFMSNEIANLEIPNSVTSIGERAFNNNKITVINGESSDGLIYKRNSDGTDNLSTIISYGGVSFDVDFIPTTVEIIYDNTFNRSNLTSITLPNSITTIGRQAFSNNLVLFGKSTEFTESLSLDYFDGVNGFQFSMSWSDDPGSAGRGDFNGDGIDDIVTRTMVLFGGKNISKIKPSEITFNTLDDATYGDEDIVLTATSSSGLDVTYVSSNPLIAEISGGKIVIIKAGTCNITASQAGNSSYEAADDVVRGFTVLKKEINIVANANQSKVYGDSEPALTYTADALVGSDTFSGDLTREAGEDVGSYAISQNTLSAGTNYDITFTGDNFNISQKSITVTVDASQSKVYGESEPTLTYTADALVGSDTFSGDLTREAGEDVGYYEILIGSLSAGVNYNLSFYSEDFEITEALSETNIKVNEYSVYPNPTKGIVYIDGEKINKVEVFNSIGKLVKTELSLTPGKAKINFSGNEKGVYFVKIYSATGNTTERVVLK